MTAQEANRSSSATSSFVPLVVGVGNDLRGDDAIGLEVARRVKERFFLEVGVLESDGDIGELLDAWQGRSLAVLIDAVVTGADAGNVVRFEARAGEVPRIFAAHMSSHALGVAETIELGLTLRQMPGRLIVYGIEAAAFEPATGISGAAQKAVDKVVELVLKDVEEERAARDG